MTHKDKMQARRMLQRNRKASVRVKTGKYIPAQEDKKHASEGTSATVEIST